MNSKQASSSRTFKCALCGETFATNKDLIKHKSIHAKDNRIFTCIQCHQPFTDHCDFLLHEVTHLRPKINKNCIECGVVKKKIDLPIHILTHFDQKKQPCEFCNVVLPVEELKKHVKTHSVLKALCECEICGRMISACKYEAHVLLHAVTKEFPCNQCEKVFKNKKMLVLHTKHHTGDLHEPCKFCGVLVYYKTLKWHENRHIIGDKYECDYCGKIYRNRVGLTIHINGHTKVFHCMRKDCKFRAPTKVDLKKHQMATHYYCKVCKTGFSNNRKFWNHNRRHKDKVSQKDEDVD